MKKEILAKFQKSILPSSSLKLIKGGEESLDAAECSISCSGGTSISCSGSSCTTGDKWVQCNGGEKTYCPST